MVDPRDIRIVETTPGGARRSMTGPHLAEEEYWDEDGSREGGQQGVASIGEDGAIDMTGVGEFQVSSISVLMSYIFYVLLVVLISNHLLTTINHIMIYFRMMKEVDGEINWTSCSHAYQLASD